MVVHALFAAASAADPISAGSAVDALGNVYVAGRFTGTLAEGGTRLASAGGSDVFVMKLDPEGRVVWVRGFGGAGDDAADSVSVTDDGLVLTGTSGGTIRFGGQTHLGRGMFVARLDADGAAVWSRSFAAGEPAEVADAHAPGQLRVLLIAGGWADVWVNGRQLETRAPLASYALVPGTYEVRLVNPFSGLEVHETVEVAAGETTTVFGRRW